MAHFLCHSRFSSLSGSSALLSALLGVEDEIPSCLIPLVLPVPAQWLCESPSLQQAFRTVTGSPHSSLALSHTWGEVGEAWWGVLGSRETSSEGS